MGAFAMGGNEENWGTGARLTGSQRRRYKGR